MEKLEFERSREQIDAEARDVGQQSPISSLPNRIRSGNGKRVEISLLVRKVRRR